MLEMSQGGTAAGPSHRSAAVADNVDANVRTDMDRVKQARNLNTKAHKDPFEQAVIYNANNDVYELFKSITVNLVLKKPKDPIKSMIDQLRSIQRQQQQHQQQQAQQEPARNQHSK